MATQTESLTKAWNSVGRIRAPLTSQPTKTIPPQAPVYNIEERQTVLTRVPFDSLLSATVHLVNWACWTLYFILRLRGIYRSSDFFVWAIYLCEVAFMVQEFQPAFDLSLSLFGPRKVFEHTQYILTGSQAPKVDVLVTVCGEDLSTIMDTVSAAAVQQYPPKRFQVFVLDDAADGNLRTAIDDFNSSNRTRRSEYQDVVYFARNKPVGQRHYYKSGNIRSGLAFTASNYGASEYFAALDSDMISEPDWLARTVPHLIKDEQVALVSPPHNYYNILQEDDLGQDGSGFSQISEPVRGFFDCSQCAGSGYILRRRALDTIGGWPLANVGEDIICSTMLQEQGWKTQFIPDQVQFGLVPDSFHSFINQRIRWTYGSLLLGNRFPFSLRRLIRGNTNARIQHITSSMGAWEAYSSALLFASAIALPISVCALHAGEADPTESHYMRLAFAGHFIASTVSRNLVYGRLGNVNVSNMITNQLWVSPVNAFCVLKSLFTDPGDTSFKVSGTFVSPTDERYPARRKPLSKRLLNFTMVCYMAYSVITAAFLASILTFVASQHLTVGAKRVHVHTGATLMLIELVLAAIVPVRYMMFPPSLPDRQALLEKDADNVNRSRKKGWAKRDGGSSVKLLLQLTVIVVFDWL